MKQWRANIAVFVAYTIQYNALVLSTSYEDAQAIGKKLQALREDMRVFIATEGVSMARLIDVYKKSVDKGELCCIVGTEQYYTGLDLAGKYLHEMFLAKIPFLPPKGRIGKDIVKGIGITKSESYLNEVIVKFTQGIGRPIRDYNDKAVLYILDGRIKKPKNLIFQKILDKKATQVDYALLNSKYKKGLLGKSGFKFHTALYTLFFSYLIDKSDREIKELFEIDNTKEYQALTDAANIILNENINIESIMTQEYFNELLKSKRFKNIWILLLKIYSEGMKQKGINIEQQITSNQYFNPEDLTQTAQDIFASLK
jgi:hypothetical protein